MDNKVVFYTKCRPGIDAWQIARKYKVAFIGYPPWKEAEHISKDCKTGYATALFDISQTPNCAKMADVETESYRKQITSNANLVRQISVGSYVIVPRPQNGLCYIGEIANPFEVVDAPIWADDYFDMLREEKILKIDSLIDRAKYFLGDTVQCWRVKEWKSIAFPLIPRWISYRLLSRNTIGIIHNITEVNLVPHSRIQQLFADNPVSVSDSNLKRVDFIAKQLLEWISPNSFEHLIVSLLQLENINTNIRWHHIGGSGDGGADGLGISDNGKVVGILQCKWLFRGQIEELIKTMSNIRRTWPLCQIFVATLLGPDEVAVLPQGVYYWGRRTIASLIDKHRDQLPLAWTLGIPRFKHEESWNSL